MPSEYCAYLERQAASLISIILTYRSQGRAPDSFIDCLGALNSVYRMLLDAQARALFED